MIERPDLYNRVRQAMRRNPVVALYGPRQCGKTTLARQIAGTGKGEYFDLEDPVSQRRLSEPMLALRDLRGLVVIDEVQRQPGLFPILRVLADRKPLACAIPDSWQCFTGVASPEFRIARPAGSRWWRWEGFSLAEVGPKDLRRLWWRGRFPRSLPGQE